MNFFSLLLPTKILLVNSKEVRFVFPESVPWVAFPYRHLFVFDFLFFLMFILQLWTDVEIRRSLFTSFRAQLFLFSLSLSPFVRVY